MMTAFPDFFLKVMLMLMLMLMFLPTGYNRLVAEEVFPYLQSPMPTSIWVCWQTAADTTTEVIYGSTPAMGKSRTGEYDELGSQVLWHSVKLTDLEPNTVYYYQIKTDDSASAVYKFKTSPVAGNRKGHLRFAIRGDTQDHPDIHTQVAAALKEKLLELYGADLESEVDFIFTVGDLVGDGFQLSQWRSQYLDPIKPLSAKVPFMAVPGNHDRESEFYYRLMMYEDFGGAEGEKYYKFQVSRALFIGLNSNVQLRKDTQIAWLESVLEEAENDTTLDWIFAFQHHPGWSALWSPGNTDYVQKRIIPLLNKYEKAEMISYGHTHGYERGSTNEGNLRMVLTGGSGGSLDRWSHNNWVDYPLIQKAYDHYNYVIVDIDLEKRSYTAQTYSLGHPQKPLVNVLIDSFYRKQVGTKPPEKPVALVPPDSVDLPYTLQASSYSGEEPLQSSHFQLTVVQSDYALPVVNAKRDFENIFLDTGPPNWEPIDQNAGIDLSKLAISFEQLPWPGQYFWRMRYRDQNLQWSEWANDQTIYIRSTGYQPPLAYNKSLKFNGVDSHVEITNDLNNAVLPVRELTLEAWVNLNSNHTWGGYIGAFQDNGSYEKGWVLGNRDKEFSFALASVGADDGDGVLTYLKAGEAFEFNRWYHVAATYTGATMRIYVNGQPKGLSSTQSGDILYDMRSYFDIGVYHDDNEFFVLDGQMDEVRLWDAALPKDMIQEWMHQEVNASHPLYANLVSYWDFNDISGNTLADIRNNNNGQLSNINVTSHVASTAPVGLDGAMVDTKSPTSTGPGGVEISVTITSTPTTKNYLGIYQSGGNDGFSIDSETYPEDVNVRSNIFWGTREYGDVVADIQIHYEQIQGLADPDFLRLLKREAANTDWVDITAEVVHDKENRIFGLAGVTEFGEFALGWDRNVTGVSEQNVSPVEYGLYVNYPNPFNPSTTIEYSLADISHVKLTVFNVLGQEVARIVDLKNQAPGHYKIAWHAHNIGSGLYFYRLEAGDFVMINRMILLK